MYLKGQAACQAAACTTAARAARRGDAHVNGRSLVLVEAVRVGARQTHEMQASCGRNHLTLERHMCQRVKRREEEAQSARGAAPRCHPA